MAGFSLAVKGGNVELKAKMFEEFSCGFYV